MCRLFVWRNFQISSGYVTSLFLYTRLKKKANEYEGSYDIHGGLMFAEFLRISEELR